MARFDVEPGRLNYSLSQTGKEYQTRLLQRAQVVFGTLLKLLPSNYSSGIQGPSYTVELKAVAVELARMELAIEDVDRDRSLPETRAEFLYPVLGYMLFLNGRLPPMQFDDHEFRTFLVAVLNIYFKGSIPLAIREMVELFLTGDVTINENFLLMRRGASGLDISDQFGFQIDLTLAEGGSLPQNIFDLDGGMRLLLNVMRPAHTLFRIRYIFQDVYAPNGSAGKILDASRWSMASYYYDDLRRYVSGIRDRDRLGVKVNEPVLDEDHSADFLGSGASTCGARRGQEPPMRESLTARARVHVVHQRAYDFDERTGLYLYRVIDEQEAGNLVTDAGRVGLHTYLYGTAAQRAAATPIVAGVGLNYIALTASGTAASAGDTTLSGELSGDGLDRVQGTVTLPTGSGTVTTIAKTFTYVGSSQVVQKTALFDAASSGRMAHEIVFTSRTLLGNDTLTLTFSITLS